MPRTATTHRLLASPGAAEERRLRRGLRQAPGEAARWLLGKRLVRRRGRSLVVARIVETEAYLGQGDPAAHSFRGRTPRTAPLWGSPGTVYVYFVYGMHHCLNFAVDEEGVPGGVLIRALEPQGNELEAGACRGPGRLCRALDLDTSFSGRHLFEPEAVLTLRDGPPPRRIGVSPRIGIRLAADRPLRFFDAESPAVSGAWRARAARVGSAAP
ncbi:MAG TPA: DNA-3-methyladenine glycosylase [Methylomirabilota bacterium]|nr:DNA-3-methyladenine glycosylase [Methylomirabilota bacterium]